MDKIIAKLQTILPEGFSLERFGLVILMLIIGFTILSILGRLIFGKKSALNQSLSAAIGILFIYAATIGIHALGLDLAFLVSPLPFVSMEGDALQVFSLIRSDYVSVCSQLLSCVILALLVNLINNLLPKGKKFFLWLTFRFLSVTLGMVVHVIVSNILLAFLPEGLVTWAPVILLGLMVLMLLLSVLKVVVGAVLATVNPILGLIYTFFFSTVLGKQLAKAILTTAILSVMVVGLNYIGVSTVFIGASALVAYIPLLLILLVLWYIIGCLL